MSDLELQQATILFIPPSWVYEEKLNRTRRYGRSHHGFAVIRYLEQETEGKRYRHIVTNRRFAKTKNVRLDRYPFWICRLL